MEKMYDNRLKLVDMMKGGLFDKQAIYPSEQCIFQIGEVFCTEKQAICLDILVHRNFLK